MAITGDILSFIPQRLPFVMVDKLLYSDEFTTETSFTVLEDNILVVDNKLTEAGMMENIAQTAAAQAGYAAKRYNQPVAIGYIGAVKKFEVFDLPEMGDELITSIKIENQVFDVTIISGTVKCNDVIMAQCEMNIFIRE